MITPALSTQMNAISDAIEYSEAVQHQVILRDQHRHILLVCLQVGICLFRHTAAQDGFIQVVEGRGILVLEGQRKVLEPGVLVMLPAGTVHSVHAISNLAFLKVAGRDHGYGESVQSVER